MKALDPRLLRKVGDLIVHEWFKFAIHQASLKHFFDELKAKGKQVTIFPKVLTDKHAVVICIKDNNLTLFYYFKK
ncbi:hypothetical protein [Nostoc sp. NOS(2021)]|uniref:hypothetical protein n=1 Tax=Nostoc sp. NOS(2021) TaxID=2815407 RepID=UPI0025EEB4CB|nr:hypothetical protein [Nostoc sp. NOS(2021)]